MHHRARYTFEGQPITLPLLKQEFSAYSEALLRDGLRAGHTTRETLLRYLVERSQAAMHRKRSKCSKPLYFAKPKGA